MLPQSFAMLLLPAAVLAQATFESGGARIFYRDSGGSGTPIVFLHAATGSTDAWEKQVPAFTASGFRFIAFDRRGWGQSTVAADPSTAADDLLHLLDHLKLARVHLVGSAAGGFVAFDFALSYPERLRSLVVANSIGGMQDPEFLEMGRRIRPPQFDALPPEFRELGPTFRAANPKEMARWMELEKRSRPEGSRAPAQPLKNRLTLGALEKIKLPVLFLTGGADLYAPPPMQEQFVAHVKGSESLVLPDVGHSAYWEQPEAFNRALLRFLRKH